MSKTHVPLDQLRDNPHQARLDVGDVDGLAETILEHGLRQLPEARLLVDGKQPSYSSYTTAHDGEWYLKADDYAIAEIASGHRRAEAVRLLNADDTVTDGDLRAAGLVPGYLPVDLQRLSDEEMLDLLTVENAQREELSPIEQARLIGELSGAGCSGQEIAERFGKSASWVSSRKRLLRLPVYVQEHVHEGEISVRQGQALARAFELEAEHEEACSEIRKSRLKAGDMVKGARLSDLDSDAIRARTDELKEAIEMTVVSCNMDFGVLVFIDKRKERVGLPTRRLHRDLSGVPGHV
jgi:ParB-like chromosome segregation protein Spo0J